MLCLIEIAERNIKLKEKKKQKTKIRRRRSWNQRNKISNKTKKKLCKRIYSLVIANEVSWYFIIIKINYNNT